MGMSPFVSFGIVNGHTADLLEDEAKPPSHDDFESGRFSRRTFSPVADGMEINGFADKSPFYRTKKDTIIHVIIAIIISAAIIGGVVEEQWSKRSIPWLLSSLLRHQSRRVVCFLRTLVFCHHPSLLPPSQLITLFDSSFLEHGLRVSYQPLSLVEIS